MSQKPLIALVHAIPDSMPSIVAAFGEGWPEADLINIVDDCLFHNLSAGTATREAVVARFHALTEYALGSATDGRKPQALLFCCSAFAYAIEAARAGKDVPILTPAEAGIEQALEAGERIALIVTAEAALPPLVDELTDMARAKGKKPELVTVIAKGAIEALRDGRPEDHDRIVAEAIASMPPVDVALMGQFTMSRAARVLAPNHNPPVLTTPGSAVRKLRTLLADGSPAYAAAS